MNNRAIILLSGGLDSVVSIAQAKSNGLDFVLALTFDYGQKSFKKELKASKEIAGFYNIKHEVIKLDWLKDITSTSLVAQCDVPDISVDALDNRQVTNESMKNVWVPNRNGLFINIAHLMQIPLGTDILLLAQIKKKPLLFQTTQNNLLMI